jgi:two-component system cell cycle sensor histidine kinase/response regulator CckA
MKQKVVLVVEDEAALASIYKKALERSGYRVLIALNGETALDILEKEDGKIDLLLSDIVMDGMGGRELVWRIRETHGHIPVILASGYANEDGALQMMEERDVVFVPKPIDLDRLLSAVRESIGEAEEGDGE